MSEKRQMTKMFQQKNRFYRIAYVAIMVFGYSEQMKYIDVFISAMSTLQNL